MASSAVTFLHNGRRQRVPIGPGDTLQNVLATYCEELGLNVSAWTLIHSTSKAPVDMGVPFRLSGVSPNAVLELKRAAAAETVRVALALPDGRRVTTSVPSNTTLAQLLASTAPELPAHCTTLSYFQQDFTPDVLETTTLQKCGLASGSGMFRVQCASPSSAAAPPAASSATVAAAAAIAPVKWVPAPPEAVAEPTSTDTGPFHPKPASPVPSPVAAPTAVHAAPLPSQPPPAIPEWVAGSTSAPEAAAAQIERSPETSTVTVAIPEPTPTEPTAVQVDGVQEPPGSNDVPVNFVSPVTATPQQAVMALIGDLRRVAFDAEAGTALKTLLTLIDNVVKVPADETFRTVRLRNPKLHDRVGRFPPAVDILSLAGFKRVVQLGEPLLAMPLEAVDFPLLLSIRGIVAAQVTNLGLPVSPSPTPGLLPSQAVFDPYKPVITRLQAVPTPDGTQAPGTSMIDDSKKEERMTAAQRQLAALKAVEERLVTTDIPPRRTAVFHRLALAARAETAVPAGETKDIDMSSPVEGSRDMEMVLKAMKRRQEEHERSQTFTTQSQRDLIEMQKKRVYQETLIRVQFDDDVIVQAAFNPRETIKSVMSWVQSLLAADFSFFLYISPPFQKLEPTATLQSLSFVPAAQVFLRWDADGGFVEPGSYLANEFQAMLQESGEATPVREVPTSIKLQPQAPGAAAAANTAGAASASGTTGSGGAAKKLRSFIKL